MPYKSDFGTFNVAGDPLSHPKTNHVLGGRLGAKHFTLAATTMASASASATVASPATPARRIPARVPSGAALTSFDVAPASFTSSSSPSAIHRASGMQDPSMNTYSKSFSSSVRQSKSPIATLAELQDEKVEGEHDAATDSFGAISSSSSSSPLSVSPSVAIPRVGDEAQRGRSRHRVPGGTSRRRGPPTERGRLLAMHTVNALGPEPDSTPLSGLTVAPTIRSPKKVQEDQRSDSDLQFDMRLSDEEPNLDDVDDDDIVDPFSKPVAISSDIEYDAKPALASMGPIMARLPSPDVEAGNEVLPVGLSYLPASFPHGTRSLLSSSKATQQQHNHKYTRSRLPVVGPKSEALWRALHDLRPNTYDYAGSFGVEDEGFCTDSLKKKERQAPHPIAPGADVGSCPAFTQDSSPALSLIRRVLGWDSLVVPKDLEGTWYGVIFRSKRRPFVHNIGLYEADRLAHEEAVSSGGLLMYWYGTPDALGSNLATCVWTSREAAKVASALPLHKKAAAKSSKAYETFELARYRLVAKAGKLSAEEWIDGGDGEEEMEGEGFR